MPKIDIKEATAKQLRDFGAVMMGLNVEGNENSNVMISRLRDAGYDDDTIMLPEQQAAPTPAGQASAAYRKNPETKKDEVCVTINVSEGNGGRRPVPVSVNGQTMLIPRATPVWIPVAYEEALRNAVVRTYEPSENGLGDGTDSLSYPYSITAPTREAKMA